MKGNKSFEQAGVNTADMKQARGKYDAAVKALAGVHPEDEKYAGLRKAKAEASLAMHRAREAAEQSYYADTVEEVVAAHEEVQKLNEENAKIAN